MRPSRNSFLFVTRQLHHVVAAHLVGIAGNLAVAADLCMARVFSFSH